MGSLVRRLVLGLSGGTASVFAHELEGTGFPEPAPPSVEQRAIVASQEVQATSQETPVWRRGVANKAQVGVANLVTGWLELPKSVARTYNETNFLFAITGGVIKGVVHVVGRTGAGLWDLFTAPIPSEPLTNPYRIWDDWRRETRYGPVFAPPGKGREVVIDFPLKERTR